MAAFSWFTVGLIVALHLYSIDQYAAALVAFSCGSLLAYFDVKEWQCERKIMEMQCKIKKQSNQG